MVTPNVLENAENAEQENAVLLWKCRNIQRSRNTQLLWIFLPHSKLHEERQHNRLKTLSHTFFVSLTNQGVITRTWIAYHPFKLIKCLHTCLHVHDLIFIYSHLVPAQSTATCLEPPVTVPVCQQYTFPTEGVATVGCHRVSEWGEAYRTLGQLSTVSFTVWLTPLILSSIFYL